MDLTWFLACAALLVAVGLVARAQTTAPVNAPPKQPVPVRHLVVVVSASAWRALSDPHSVEGRAVAAWLRVAPAWNVLTDAALRDLPLGPSPVDDPPDDLDEVAIILAIPASFAPQSDVAAARALEALAALPVARAACTLPETQRALAR